MRTLISLAHISLDGFMATPARDMSFLTMNAEMADHIYPVIASVDTSVYGRITYELMEGYWPTAGDSPTATDHEKSHARWYKNVRKIVASRTLPPSPVPSVRVVGDDIVGVLRAAKQESGGDIMIFASPTLTHTLAAADLVDEWRLTIQPVAIGGGLPLFAPDGRRTRFELRDSKTFANGVIAAHYVTKR